MRAQKLVPRPLNATTVSVRPFDPFIVDGFVFMHDNARPYTAHVARDHLDEVAITQMDWPARSPVINDPNRSRLGHHRK